MERFSNDKIALITGASGAIGSAIAITLAKNGIDVILHYNESEKEIKDIENKCREFGVFVHVEKANLANYQELQEMFSRLANNELKPSILVNTVGIPQYGLIQDVDYSIFEQVINTNIMSSFFCSKSVVSNMVYTGYGRIINISSVWGNVGAANEVLYSLTKGAINSLTKALAKELAPSGITVNAIAPGMVLSNMTKQFSEEELNDLREQIPLNRFANGDEIAQTVLHLIHDNSSYITGQIITIDGGWT